MEEPDYPQCAPSPVKKAVKQTTKKLIPPTTMAVDATTPVMSQKTRASMIETAGKRQSMGKGKRKTSVIPPSALLAGAGGDDEEEAEIRLSKAQWAQVEKKLRPAFEVQLKKKLQGPILALTKILHTL
jgi:hypothetical protein